MKYKIENDQYPNNPREWDNLTKMVCFHNRYDLGDDLGYNKNNYNSWDELAEQLEEDFNILVIKPLYLFDHSGITISTSGFNCKWDSGQVGFVFITEEDIDKEYDNISISEKLDIANIILEEEVKLYDCYITGEVYNILEDDEIYEEGIYGYSEALDRLEELKSM